MKTNRREKPSPTYFKVVYLGSDGWVSHLCRHRHQTHASASKCAAKTKAFCKKHGVGPWPSRVERIVRK